ncbi:MAG TPA: MDR family MFS transporter [Actinospica sp.]|nr:MDR family MFS transporter [Actinospica sp.]
MSTTAPGVLETASGRQAAGHKKAVAIVYVAAIFLSTMDTTIVNVALPTIGRDFHVATSSVDSVSISYLVSLAVFVPASGWLGDRFGGRRTLLTAVAVFTAASALCGLAGSLGELVFCRILQGAGGGMLASVGMAMLLRAYRPAERVRVSAVLTMAIALAPTCGPVLGGLLVTDLSWRWVFYVNVPIGIFACVFGGVRLEKDHDLRGEHFDAAGFLLSAGGLGLAMYGISIGPDRGWGSTPVLAALSAGLVLLVVMAAVELRAPAPVLDIRLVRDRLFSACSASMTLESVAFLGALFILSLYYQDGRGLSALGSGLSTAPEALGVMCGSQLASRVLYRRLGPRRQLIAGTLASSVFMGLLSLPGGAHSLWWMRGDLVLMGLGVGQVFVATQAAAFATIPARSTGRASTMFNVGRRLGGALGVAVATTSLVLVGRSARTSGAGADLAAYQVAFLVAAATNLFALLPALAVRDEQARSTVPAPRRA